MSIEKIFCTTREAATLLGVSVGTAQLWVDNGLLTAWRTPGGHRRVTRESINKLLHMKAGLPAVLTGEAGGAQMKVLIVEDSSNLRRLYEIVLAQWPMSPRITTVDNGIEAAMLLEQERPDLLVVDLDTPGIDGFRLVGILKKNPKYADITVVVVSGLDEIDIVKRGGVPPDVFVLRKPVPFAKLLAIASGIEDARKNGVGAPGP
ncbi:response regulator [Polaromonas sp. YR568]|uniref:response regulator n=1 Tax=Polaromonas sp. YR568 TaxID=1855301 RepID=UPI00398C16CE